MPGLAKKQRSSNAAATKYESADRVFCKNFFCGVNLVHVLKDMRRL